MKQKLLKIWSFGQAPNKTVYACYIKKFDKKNEIGDLIKVFNELSDLISLDVSSVEWVPIRKSPLRLQWVRVQIKHFVDIFILGTQQ